jgi:hypothetical protein
MNDSTMQRYGRALALALAVALLGTALAGCGGGGGGDGGAAPGPAAPNPPAPTGPSSPTAPTSPPGGGTTHPLAVTAALGQGAYLQFLATTSATSAAVGSNSTSDDYGLFTLTLGQPMQVAGVSGHAVTVSGKTLVGGHQFRPAWTFIAQVGTRWVGSADGATLLTLFDPALPAGTTGFFLGATGARQLAAGTGRFDGAYNTYDGVTVADASSDGGCQWVASVEICSASSTTFSQREVLLDGIGPVGFLQRIGYIVGGSAPQTVQRMLKLELVATSLAARNGTLVQAPPWRQVAAMPVARFDARAAAVGSRIYLFGGVSDDPAFDARRVDVFDLPSRSWLRAPDAPRSLSGWLPTVVGSQIALFGGTDGLLFDPGSGRWTATARLLASGSITGVGSRTQPDGSAEVMAIVDPGVSFLQATLARYRPGSNSWQTLGTFERGQRANYEAVLLGDSFFLIGGFANGSYISAVSVVDVVTRQVQRQRALLSDAVVQPAVGTLGGQIVVAGGYNFGGTRRSVQTIDPATGRVSDGPALLGGLQGATAATANGALVLFGGRASADRPAALTEAWLLQP